MNYNENIQIGNQVRRIQGRPSDIGRSGTVTFVSDKWVVGAAGDMLVEVKEADGGTFRCYTRQVEVV